MLTASLSPGGEVFNPHFIPLIDPLRHDQQVVELRGIALVNSFAARLRAYKADNHLSLEALGKMAGGKSAQAVHKWLAGGDIDDENLEALARVTGIPASWWRYGEDKPKAVSEKGRRYEAESKALTVPIFNAKASMGPGVPLPDNDTVVGGLQLSTDWVQRHLPAISSPRNLALVSAMGDSMAPTFADGDLLLVDRGVFEIKLDAIYVLAKDDELYIKRVQRRLGGGVVIKSDNPLHESEEVPDPKRVKLRILGRVVWAWNGRRL